MKLSHGWLAVLSGATFALILAAVYDLTRAPGALLHAPACHGHADSREGPARARTKVEVDRLHRQLAGALAKPCSKQ